MIQCGFNWLTLQEGWHALWNEILIEIMLSVGQWPAVSQRKFLKFSLLHFVLKKRNSKWLSIGVKLSFPKQTILIPYHNKMDFESSKLDNSFYFYFIDYCFSLY